VFHVEPDGVEPADERDHLDELGRAELAQGEDSDDAAGAEGVLEGDWHRGSRRGNVGRGVLMLIGRNDGESSPSLSQRLHFPHYFVLTFLPPDGIILPRIHTKAKEGLTHVLPD